MKITTHDEGNGYFSVTVGGRPLLGDKGGLSKFSTRKEAKEEALRRMNLPHNQEGQTHD